MKHLFVFFFLFIVVQIAKSNQAPLVYALPNIEIIPAARITIPIIYTDNDENDTHFISIKSNNPLVYIENISGNKSGSTFELVTSKDFTGSTDVIVTVNDGTENASATFSIHAVNELSTDIKSNITLPSGTFEIYKNLTITKNATLTLSPGTTLKMADGVQIFVYGGFVAQGREKETIIFKTSYFWDGITFDQAEKVKIDFCEFETVSSCLKVVNCKSVKIDNSFFSKITNYNVGSVINAVNSSISIRNCIFKNNYAGSGGIIYTDNSIVKITNSLFENNNSGSYGGALFIVNSGLQLLNNKFISNSSGTGGALYFSSEKELFIRNNIFLKNFANNSGGALYINRTKKCTLVNNLIAGNKISAWIYQFNGGGAMYFEGADAVLNNNTIVNNFSGICTRRANVLLNNNIIALNNISINSDYEPLQILPYENSSFTFNNDLLEGGISKIGRTPDTIFTADVKKIIDGVPNFVNLEEEDYRLMNDSACINAGIIDTTGLFLEKTDILGNDRIIEGIIDLGSIEYNGIKPNRKPKIEKIDDHYFDAGKLVLVPFYFKDLDAGDVHKVQVISENPDFVIQNITIGNCQGSFEIKAISGFETSGMIKVKITDNSNTENASDSIFFTVGSSNVFYACGNITQNTIWDIDTVYIDCNLTIANTATLTLKPGTVLLFNDYVSLNVDGNLYARGTVQDSIVFSRKNNSSVWGGLFFNSRDILLGNDSSLLKYCKFEYSFSGINISYRANIAIENSLIQYNSSSGISTYSNGPIKNNIIRFNNSGYEGGGIRSYSNALIANNLIYKNNSYQGGGVAFASGSLIGNIIVENSSSNSGGGVMVMNTISLFANNTICNNTAPYGSGLYCYNNINILNSIIWGNKSQNESWQLYSGNVSTIINCNVQDLFLIPAVNILGFCHATDPLFKDTSKLDYSLLPASRNINAGKQHLFILEKDVLGQNRVSDSLIDIGAAEYQGVPQNRLPIIRKKDTLYFNPSHKKEIRVRFDEFDRNDSNYINVVSIDTNLKVLNAKVDTLGGIFEISTFENYRDSSQVIVSIGDKSNQFSELNTDTFYVVASKVYHICGQISENTVWDADTVFIDCNVTLDSGVTLTIFPGVKVIFTNSYALQLNGSVKALGASSNPIIFCSITPNFYSHTISVNLWNDFDSCIFVNCIFNDSYYGLQVQNKKLIIDSCTFENCYYGAIYGSNNHSRIKNSTFKNINSNGITLKSDSVWVENNTFKSCYYALSLNNVKDGTVINNHFDSNYYAASIASSSIKFLNNKVEYNRGNAVMITNDNLYRPSWVVNNLIANNNGKGLYIYSNDYIPNYTRVYNNTICYNNTYEGIGVYVGGNSFAEFKNNIIYFNKGTYSNNQFLVDVNSNPSVENCNIQGLQNVISNSYSNYSGVFKNNIDVAPSFVSNEDFHLSDSSLCINAGNELVDSIMPEIDLEGNNRIYKNVRIDLGAYELQQEPKYKKLLYTKFQDVHVNLGDSVFIAKKITNQIDTLIYTIVAADTNVHVNSIINNNNEIQFLLKANESWKGSTIVHVCMKDSVTDWACDSFRFTVSNVLEICGLITQPTIWNYDTVRVSCNISISKNASLKIMPGTKVFFNFGAGLNCYGSIVAQGTKDNPIVFSSRDTVDFWNGMRIYYPFNTKDSVYFEYCTFEQSSNTSLYISSCQNAKVRNCLFLNNMGSDGGAIYCEGSYMKIENNIFRNNYAINSGGAIGSNYYSHIDIFNNLIDHNSSYYGGGISINGSCNIANNTIVKNNGQYGYGVYIGYNYNNEFQNFENNIVYYNSGYNSQQLVYNWTQNLQIRNCDFEDMMANFEDCIFEEPLFIDTSKNDFHVNSKSPVINKGIDKNVKNLLTVDYEGNPRIYNNGIIDIGAYEYQNNPPQLLLRGTSITENTIGPIIVDTLETYDIDGDSIYLFIKNRNDFALDSVKGYLTYTGKTLDYEQTQLVNLSIALKENNVEFNFDYPITIKNINDNTPICESNLIMLNENLQNGAVLYTVQGNDADSNLLSYTFQNISAPAGLKLEENQLILKDANELDYELGKRNLWASVIVSDGMHSDTARINFRIQNVNDNPCYFTGELLDKLDTIAIDENIPESTNVYQLLASDADSLEPLIFTVNNNQTFHVEANHLVVSDNSLINYEWNKQLQASLNVSDGYFNDYSQLTIDLNNVNDLPVVNDTIYYVLEGTKRNTVIGKLRFFDEDNDSIQVKLISEKPLEAFGYNQEKNEIYVNDTLDYEKTRQFQLKFSLSDGNVPIENTIELKLINVNDNDIILEKKFDFIKVSYYMNIGQSVYTIWASDPDSMPLYYSIESDPYNLFYLNKNTLCLRHPSEIEISKLPYDLLVSVNDGLYKKYLSLRVYDSLIEYSKIICYPNPSNGIVNFEFGPEKTVQQVEVFTSQGLKVAQYQFGDVSYGKFSLQGYKPGMYFIQFSGKNYKQLEKIMLDAKE